MKSEKKIRIVVDGQLYPENELEMGDIASETAIVNILCSDDGKNYLTEIAKSTNQEQLCTKSTRPEDSCTKSTHPDESCAKSTHPGAWSCWSDSTWSKMCMNSCTSRAVELKMIARYLCA